MSNENDKIEIEISKGFSLTIKKDMLPIKMPEEGKKEYYIETQNKTISETDDKELNQIITKLIETLRTDKGVSKTELAETLHPGMISARQNLKRKLETGTLKFQELLKLAEILGTEVILREK